METRNITTNNYLSESVARHREADHSLLRNYLNVREKDVMKDWNKPGRPGPKVNAFCRNIRLIKSSAERRSNGKTWRAEAGVFEGLYFCYGMHYEIVIISWLAAISAIISTREQWDITQTCYNLNQQ